MILFVFAQAFSSLLDLLFSVTRSSEHQKDLQIMLLRQMERRAVLRLLQRRQGTQAKAPRISSWEKSILAVLAARLKSLSKTAGTKSGKCLDDVMSLFKPETVLKWL